jgi:hypothetical protein
MEPEGIFLHSQVPAPLPILSQVDKIYASTSHFLKIHLNITLPSTPGSSKCPRPRLYLNDSQLARFYGEELFA